LLNQEVDLQKALHRACKEEEEYWCQKSRSLWLQAEDNITSYFHKQSEAQNHFKAITEIQFQGKEIKDFEGIKQVAHDFFKDLYSAPCEAPVDPNSYPLSLIPPASAE
jgi:hypothetical protein